MVKFLYETSKTVFDDVIPEEDVEEMEVEFKKDILNRDKLILAMEAELAKIPVKRIRLDRGVKKEKH